MELEDILLRHPEVRRCAVLLVAPGETPVAYVETDTATPAELRDHLLGSGLPEKAVPPVIVPMKSLPLNEDGSVDRAALPQPPLPSAVAIGKSGEPMACGPVVWGIAAAIVTFFGYVIAKILTDVFWPGSTDTTMVPSPWAGLFTVLYNVECLSFGLGVAFLLLGRPGLNRLGRPAGWTALAHLSIVWLLVAWWPQDNWYRLASKVDWPRQAALVFGFNVTLMLAAAALAAFAVTSRRPD